MSRNDSEIAFKRSPEWALARSVERGTVLKSPLTKPIKAHECAYADPPPLCPLRLVFDAINAIERCVKGKETKKNKAHSRR